MRVLLIQPPVRDYYFTPIRSFPLGLCYIAAAVENAGHEVSILDCVQGGRKAVSIRDEDFAYLDAFYPTDTYAPYGLFKGLKQYGLSFDDIRDHIQRYAPDVVGVSSLFSAYADEAMQVCREVKKVDPSILTCMGGAHVHEYAHDVLNQDNSVDVVIRGEGEDAFVALLANRDDLSLVPNVVYRDGGTITETAVVVPTHAYDDLRPARHLVCLDNYCVGGKRYTPIITSRGCPHHCSFCAIPHMWGHTLRVRTPQGVVAEILDCYDRYAMRIFDIEDDNFTAHRQYATDVLHGLIAARGDRDIEITAMNGLYYTSLDDDLLTLLHEAGMSRLNISLVSSSESTGTAYERDLNTDRFEAVVRKAHALGMHITAYYIIGLPGETVHSMVESVRYLSTLPVLIGPSVYYHVPGSPLYEALAQEGRVRHDSYRFYRSSALFYEDDAITRHDLVTLFYLTRLVNIWHRQGNTAAGEATHAAPLCVTAGDCISLQTDERDQFLLALFIQNRELYALKKVAKDRYQLVALPQSQRVIAAFFSVFPPLSS